MAATLSIELTEEQLVAIERLSAQAGKSPGQFAADALVEAIAADSRFRNEVEQGLREADAGDFATDGELLAVIEKWGGA